MELVTKEKRREKGRVKKLTRAVWIVATSLTHIYTFAYNTRRAFIT
jgi:hypothetical protein